MSDNPRMDKWLQEMNEANKLNPNSNSALQQDPYRVISQEVVYIPQNQVYVGFWRRVFAYLIDSMILGVFYLITRFHPMVEWIISFFYFTFWPSTHLQGTIGKLAIGAKIVDARGQRLNFIHSVGRLFAQMLSGILLMIGYLMIAFHNKKRGLHDMLANTFVVNK